MRILFVTPYLPSRIRIRSFQFIKALSRWHDISLVCLLCDDYEHAMLPEIQPYCCSIDYIRISRPGSYARCLQSLPTHTPLRVAYYQSPAFKRLIIQVARRQACSLIHGELIKVAPALLFARDEMNLPCLFDAVDCMSSLLMQQVQHAPLWQRLFLASELRKMRHYEPRMFARCDQVVITSQTDENFLQSLEDPNRHRYPIQVISNGIDTSYYTLENCPREDNLLVFCAKLDYFPNAQAMLDFCRDVMPLLWRYRPAIRLEIVGCQPPKVISSLGIDPRIKVIGAVPDIRPYLARATVAVAPLKVAVGVQNKVLEAFSMATPLVASPRTCRTFAVKDGIELLFAESPWEWACAILRLLENADFALSLGRAGHAFILTLPDWQHVARRVSELYDTLIAGASGGVLCR